MTKQLSEDLSPLPSCITVDIKNHIEPEVLRRDANYFTFPLSEDDFEDIQKLISVFDSHDNAAGLAAPQIGISKRAIVFSADDEELKKYRVDFTQAMPKSIWLNPSYVAIGDDKTLDVEACLSVEGYAGYVKRFNKIEYTAYNTDGEKIEGTAEGYLARLLQHEIDHLSGILYIDIMDDDQELLDIEEFRKRRKEAIEKSEEM